MPNCDFYAMDQDVVQIVHFVFSQPGWVLYELSSRPQHELRCFSDTEQLLQAFDLRTKTEHFQLYAPEMQGRVYQKRIDVDEPEPGNAFWHESRGWGLIQLYFVAVRDGRLRASHTNHNSERRARAWQPTYAEEPDSVDDWDWRAVHSTSGRLNRFIRGRAVSKSGTRAVLPCAHEQASSGRVVLSS
jgi:hypothetical protein